MEGLVKIIVESYLHDIGHCLINFLRDRRLIEVFKTDIVGRIEQVKSTRMYFVIWLFALQRSTRVFLKVEKSVSHFPIKIKGWARMSLRYNPLDPWWKIKVKMKGESPS